MEKFRDFSGLAVPFVKNDIDTDLIIPKQFLTSVRKTGYGLFLFNDIRWVNPAPDATVTRAELEPAPDFPLNEARYRGAEVLLAGANFGCGSSREHAVWALADYGFRTVIAPSFADIFAGNASKNGLLLVRLPEATVREIEQACLAEPGFQVGVMLSVDKPHIEVGGERHHFEIDARDREFLLEGLDDIGVTERMRDDIAAYEERRRQLEPWLEI